MSIRKKSSMNADPDRWRGISIYGFLTACMILAIGMFILAYDTPKDALLPQASVRVEREGNLLGARTVPLLISSASDPSFIPGTYTFNFEFNAPGDRPMDGGKALVFPQVAGSSLLVKLNGVLLGIRGDPATGQSSIWNAVHIFRIPEGLLSRENKVEAVILGTYEAGIILRPYLLDTKPNSARLSLIALFSDYAIWLSIGAILAVSFIVLSMGFFDKTNRLANILLGLAGLSVAAFLTDFAYLQQLPISLVAFKKMVVSLRHLASAFFIIAYLKLLGRKLDFFAIFFVALQLACSALVLAYPGSIVDIKRLYGYTYLTFMPFLVYLFVIMLPSFRKGGSLRIIAFGVVVAFASATRDIVMLVLVKDNGAVMVSHFGFIVLALSSCIYVVNDALNHYSALVVEQRRAATFREEALRDELTGSYNRKIFPALAQDLLRPYSILAVDIDNLKIANDEFGHAAGDAILVDLVGKAKRNIRADDCVVRTGGDEFLLVLRACPLEVACTIAEHLIEDCAHSRISIVTKIPSASEARRMVSYSISIGIAYCRDEASTTYENLMATQRQADVELYRAKNSGKGRWCAEGSESGPSLA